MDRYISYDDVHYMISILARRIHTSAASLPTIIIAIGTGGFIPARIMKTFLNIDMRCVIVNSYDGDVHVRETPVKIQWLNEKELESLKDHHVLVVDEVNDSGTTLNYVVQELLPYCQEISACVLQHKKKTKSGRLPEKCLYWSYEEIEDVWCHYPWNNKDDKVSGLPFLRMRSAES